MSKEESDLKKATELSLLEMKKAESVKVQKNEIAWDFESTNKDPWNDGKDDFNFDFASKA